jgi:myosin-5
MKAGSVDVVEDLTQLKMLNEGSMLDCLGQRYANGSIYTFTGPVLLAVNPFAQVPHLYNMDKVRTCQGGTRIPHIFSIAQSAYNGILGSVLDQQSHEFRNQSILISGESGAGKTETTKLVMKYLSLCGHSEYQLEQSSIERKVLETNPLLEAFGNAKTLRNDNSSRFGKFIQLQFGSAKLTGARIETYLLEKVRVCSQSAGERNFHIFYQCCAAAAAMGGNTYDFPQLISSDERFRLKLNGFTDMSYFNYLSSESASLSSIDDLLEFERTVEALRVIGLSVRDIEELLGVVAAVLHIGNIEFTDKHDSGGEEGCFIPSRESLFMACALLGIGDPDILESALCTRGISVSAAEEGYRTPLSSGKAVEVRDAFARFLYHSIFSFLVEISNLKTCSDGTIPFVGLLDIFGFEYFEINTFEQLCINYANERLQHLFVDHVLRAEQSVYDQEGIPWNRFDFPDNEGVLTLLHHPLTGVLPMLDEECRIVGGNDGNYLSKLIKMNLEKSENFSTIKTKKDWFVINHFAGSVAYKVSSGFVDKNRDTLSMDVVELMNESPILTRICASTADRFSVPGTSNPGGKVLRSKIYTVSSEFRGQLNRLMEIISETRPLFVRCIKPNMKNLPNIFDPNLVLDQLRYGGVLQAVQISRAGFPVRVSHEEFSTNFAPLMKRRGNLRDMVRELCASNAVLGTTKVFMKQSVWDHLTEERNRIRNRAAVRVQAFLKMAVARIEFITARKVLVSVQSVIRSAMVVWDVNRNRAAAKIQASFLAWAVRQYFLQARASVIMIQRAVRRRLLKTPQSVPAPVITRKRNSSGIDANLVKQMEQLGKEIRDAKQTMKTVDRLAYFNSGTPNQSYFAPHIPPAPFVPARRGAVRSRFVEGENAPPPPKVRTASAFSTGKIGSIEKRVMKVHDDMARMKELIDRIQNNMSDM